MIKIERLLRCVIFVWALALASIIGIITGGGMKDDTIKPRTDVSNSDAERINRTFVKVRMEMLRELVREHNRKNMVTGMIGLPRFEKEDGKTYIGIDNVPVATLLNDDNYELSKRHDSYYKKGGTALFLETEMVEKDTIVHCPANILVYLVEQYEK